MAPQRLDYMYRKEFSEALAHRIGVSDKDADEIVTAFLDVLQEAWFRKRSVCFANFGIFELRTICERMGRNPKTMEEHLIPEGYKPAFRPTKGLRDAINQSIRANADHAWQTEHRNTASTHT